MNSPESKRLNTKEAILICKNKVDFMKPKKRMTNFELEKYKLVEAGVQGDLK